MKWIMSRQRLLFWLVCVGLLLAKLSLDLTSKHDHIYGTVGMGAFYRAGYCGDVYVEPCGASW
jgi:hypothetical protein